MVRPVMPLAALTQRLARPHCVHVNPNCAPSRLAQTRRPHVVWRPHRRVSTKSSSSPSPDPLPPPPSSHAAPAELTDREMLMRLLRRPNRQWYWLGGVAFVGATLVAFGPELKLGVSKHTAEVATKSLQDETLQRNTRELASQIVQTVLNDAQVLDQASFFIQRLVVMDTTRDALRSLVVHTLNDAVTLAHVTNLARALLVQLLDDANTRTIIVAFLRQTMQDPETRAALLKLLDELMKDDTLRRNLAQLLAQTFVTNPVKMAVAETVGDAVHDVLSRGDIQTHAKQFVGSVVGDQTVQAQSGDAIWGTVMYAITPGWLSWMWEGGGDEKEVPVAAVVAVPVVEAEVDALVDDASEVFSEAVATHTAQEEAVHAAPTTQDADTEEPSSEREGEEEEAPPPSRFEMLRRFTMSLPLLSSSSSSSAQKDKQAKERAEREAHEQQERESDAQRDHDDAERHWRGPGGSSGLF